MCLSRPLDNLAVFETAFQGRASTAPTRYAIRQVLDQEYQKYLLRQRNDVRQASHKAGSSFVSKAGLSIVGKGLASVEEDGVNLKPIAVNRDFFGRSIDVALSTAKSHSSLGERDLSQNPKLDERGNVWVSYHEGFSNAVRKPITLDELMRGF